MPTAHVYESITHNEEDVVFGIDLRKWADGGWSALRTGSTPKDAIPEVLSAMLNALNAIYVKLPDDLGTFLNISFICLFSVRVT